MKTFQPDFYPRRQVNLRLYVRTLLFSANENKINDINVIVYNSELTVYDD